MNSQFSYLYSSLKACPTTVFRTRWPSISSASSLWKWCVIMTFPEWVRLPGFTSRRNQPSSCVTSSGSSCQGRWEQAWIPSHGSAFNSYLWFSCGNWSHESKGLGADARHPDLRKLPATSWLPCIFGWWLPISHLCNFHAILDAEPPLPTPKVCFFKVQSTPLKYSHYSS